MTSRLFRVFALDCEQHNGPVLSSTFTMPCDVGWSPIHEASFLIVVKAPLRTDRTEQWRGAWLGSAAPTSTTTTQRPPHRLGSPRGRTTTMTWVVFRVGFWWITARQCHDLVMRVRWGGEEIQVSKALLYVCLAHVTLTSPDSIPSVYLRQRRFLVCS